MRKKWITLNFVAKFCEDPAILLCLKIEESAGGGSWLFLVFVFELFASDNWLFRGFVDEYWIDFILTYKRKIQKKGLCK